MRAPSEIQNRIISRIKGELERLGVKLLEDRVGLVEGSPSEDVYWFLRTDKRVDLYIYEDGEGDLRGPLRERIFEIPDFIDAAEMEEGIVEEVIFQNVPGQIEDVRYQALLKRRRTSFNRFLVFVAVVFASIILYFFIRNRY